MRIVINGWFWDQLSTGSGQYLTALASWLPRTDSHHDLVVVTNPPIKAQPIAQVRLVEAHTPFDRLNRNLAKLWFEQVTFPELCQRLGATVALVPYWGSPWWRPCPIVVTIHDLIPVLLPLYRGGPLQRLYTALVSRTARRAHAVLADSEASRRDIIEHLGIPAAQVHAVPLAVDPRFRPISGRAELAQVRARYRLPDESFLLYLGGFDARKNVVRIVQAYAKIVADEGQRTEAEGRKSIGDEARQDRPMSPKLVIAGRLPESDSAFAPDPRQLVQALGLDHQIYFTGWVDEADKPALYSLATSALFISEYEGFGLPVLEAMACGCAVITAQSA
jgi:glycosyltransferase involved in cell wall biosynthesis